MKMFHPAMLLVVKLSLAASLTFAADSTIIAPGAKLEKLGGGYEFTEGPAHGPDGYIYFSDIGNRIMKYDPKTNKTTEFRNPSGRANGLTLLARL